MVIHAMKDDWRSVTVTTGALSVMIPLTVLTLLLHASYWDSTPTVSPI